MVLVCQASESLAKHVVLASKRPPKEPWGAPEPKSSKNRLRNSSGFRSRFWVALGTFGVQKSSKMKRKRYPEQSPNLSSTENGENTFRTRPLERDACWEGAFGAQNPPRIVQKKGREAKRLREAILERFLKIFGAHGVPKMVSESSF